MDDNGSIEQRWRHRGWQKSHICDDLLLFSTGDVQDFVEYWRQNRVTTKLQLGHYLYCTTLRDIGVRMKWT